MLKLCCFVLLVGVVLGLETDAEWEKFKSTYGKTYSEEDEPMRKEIFQNNVETITEHNLRHDKGEVGFRQGINKYSDMGNEEFVTAMNGVKKYRTHKRTNKVFKPTGRPSSTPSLDWRDMNVVSPVADQGPTCGDCWAYSATGAIESAWAIANNLTNGDMIVLSAQQLTDCANNSAYDCDGCDGGWPDDAMWYVHDNKGQDTLACYPDNQLNITQQCVYEPSCMAVTIDDVHEVIGDETVLKEALEGRPISVCMNASLNDFQNYESGIYDNPECNQDTDHAVLLIGYGTENGTEYWLLKNSYGTGWGEEGFFKLARNQNDLCGITTNASFPIVYVNDPNEIKDDIIFW